MRPIFCIVAMLALVGVASATPYTVWSNTFDDATGVTVRPNDPNNPTTGPFYDDGGQWGHVPFGSIGYQIMDVQMVDLQAPEVLDFTFGQLTIELQIEGEWTIPDEFQGFWLRVYSRRWNDTNQEWEYSGSQNYYYDVEHTSNLLGFGPGWQTFVRDVDDWDETNGFGRPYYSDQIYKFRLDCPNWTGDITPFRFGISHFEFVAPECPYDLDGDDDLDLGDLAVMLANYDCAPHPAINVWTAGGFEGYTLGDLPGQDGWTEDTTDPNNYGVVQVIDDPTGGGMGKVIDLTADNPVVGGWIGAAREGIDLTADYIVVEWDQWRDGLEDNVWVADAVAFDGWWAMQWDQNQQASSYFFDFGVPLTAGEWEHVMYVIDTTLDTATVIVGGQSYTGPSAVTDDTLNGIVFEFEPTDAGPGAGEILYVDNVTIGTVPDLDYLFGCTREQGDLDGNGTVDLGDLATLLGDYGCGTAP